MTKKHKNEIWITYLFIILLLGFLFSAAFLSKKLTNCLDKKADTVKVEVVLKATEAPEGNSYTPSGYEPHERKLVVKWVNGEPYSLLDSLKTQVTEVKDSTLATCQKCSAAAR